MKILAIVGPTATGKTRLGVALAHALGSDIVSADSRQVYRGLDIGTGKDLGEYAAVDPPIAHHLIDIVDPEEVYTLFRYQQDAFGVIRSLAVDPRFADGERPVLMVGGSGLYLEAVLRQYRLADVPEDPALRAERCGWSRDALERRLTEEAPDLLDSTDTGNRRRLIRSLEIAAARRHGPVGFGRPLGLDPDIRVVRLAVDRSLVRTRIARRLMERLNEGMVDEVRRLLAGGLPPQRLDELGLEYREIGAFLAGRKPYAAMVEDLRRAIGRFAKRQDTWFRGMNRRGLPVVEIAQPHLDRVADVLGPWLQL